MGFDDIQLADLAVRTVYGMAAAGILPESSLRIRNGLAIWLNVWAPEVARSLAQSFIDSFKTLEALRHELPDIVNKPDILRPRLQVEERQWRCTIEALRIAEKFAPEEDGLWIYGAEFWSTLATWAKQAETVGLALGHVPEPPGSGPSCEKP